MQGPFTEAASPESIAQLMQVNRGINLIPGSPARLLCTYLLLMVNSMHSQRVDLLLQPDAGESWSPLLIGTDGITLMAEFDGGLYMKATKNMNLNFFAYLRENDRLIRIPEMSLFSEG